MKRVLVALDHSPRAPLILDRAAAIAKLYGAELFLLRAVTMPSEIPHEAFRSTPQAVMEQWRADSVGELERIAGTIDPTIVTHVLVRVGSPWSAICESAKEHDVDLVVVGSHGYDALDRVLGTTAAKVVNHTTKSVLVVRE